MFFSNSFNWWNHSRNGNCWLINLFISQNDISDITWARTMFAEENQKQSYSDNCLKFHFSFMLMSPSTKKNVVNKFNSSVKSSLDSFKIRAIYFFFCRNKWLLFCYLPLLWNLLLTTLGKWFDLQAKGMLERWLPFLRQKCVRRDSNSNVHLSGRRNTLVPVQFSIISKLLHNNSVEDPAAG